MKKISVIGIGKLGICYALNLERAGYDVLGVDVNQEYVDAINNKEIESPEPEVSDLLTSSKNFRATTDLKEAIDFSGILFILVRTPSLENGRYDHSTVDDLIEKINLLGKQQERKHFIVGCTVMPGYCNSIEDNLSELNYSLSYNPEFIAQGTIIRDQLRPDMVLIGTDDDGAFSAMEEIYLTLCENEPATHRMSPISAEITKIALNCFITAKITFANMIGDIAISSGADYEKILYAIGSDSRVGNKYLGYGYGFGGPCFPRDNRALFIHSDDVNYDAKLSKIIDDANEYHLDFQVNEYIRTHQDKETPIVIDSVTYKKGSVIIEESQQLLYAVKIAEAGYNVVLTDSNEVLRNVEKEYGNLFKYEPKDMDA